MATLGLKGVWGLGHLHRTDLDTWKLGLLLMGASGLAGWLVALLLGEVDAAQSRSGPHVVPGSRARPFLGRLAEHRAEAQARQGRDSPGPIARVRNR